MKEPDKKYTEGHFIGLWVGIGMALCTPIGVVFSIVFEMPGLIGIGPAIGVSIGVAIGVSTEEKYKKEGKIRPLTDTERNKRKKTLIYIVGAGALLVIALAISFIALK